MKHSAVIIVTDRSRLNSCILSCKALKPTNIVVGAVDGEADVVDLNMGRLLNKCIGRAFDDSESVYIIESGATVFDVQKSVQLSEPILLGSSPCLTFSNALIEEVDGNFVRFSLGWNQYRRFALFGKAHPVFSTIAFNRQFWAKNILFDEKLTGLLVWDFFLRILKEENEKKICVRRMPAITASLTQCTDFVEPNGRKLKITERIAEGIISNRLNTGFYKGG